MRKLKVLITGSSGMLGRAICCLLAKDYHVCGIDLENSIRLVNFFKCDITKHSLFRKITLKVRPDIIIHTAAYTDVDECEVNKKKAGDINIKASANIAMVCRDIDCTLIFISTDYVFNGRKKSPYLEKDKPSPLNVYGKTKFDAERFISNNLDRYILARTTWLYGNGGKNFVDTIVNNAKLMPLLRVVDNQRGSPTYVLDLAAALRILIKKVILYPGKYYGIYNITNSGSCSWYRFAKEIIKVNRLNSRVISSKIEYSKRPAKRPENSVLSNSKFNRLTGRPMRNWKEALCAYLQNKK